MRWPLCGSRIDRTSIPSPSCWKIAISSLKKALDRLAKQREEQEKEIGRVTAKLENQDFVAKAPAEVLTEHRTRLRSLQHDHTMLASSEQQLRALLGA